MATYGYFLDSTNMRVGSECCMTLILNNNQYQHTEDFFFWAIFILSLVCVRNYSGNLLLWFFD